MSRTTSLYRMYDASDALLYVGVTSSPSRFGAHRRSQPWWHEVVRVEVKHYATREAALRAEAAAIRNQRPRHNIKGAPKSPRKGGPWITAEEFAARIKVTERRIIKELKAGQIWGALLDGCWFISEAEWDRCMAKWKRETDERLEELERRRWVRETVRRPRVTLAEVMGSEAPDA